MNYNLSSFSLLDSLFEPNDNYFLNQQLEHFQINKPLKGIKILQNIPLTFETLKKVEVLASSGAELTITNVSIIPPEMKAKKVLEDAGIHVELDHDNIKNNYDIILDCSAEFLGKITPRIGTVELTRTGALKYRDSKDLAYPVIDIDFSRTKKIETVLGTSEGFFRAFKELTSLNDLSEKPFTIFGFGKVGQGITRRLLDAKAIVTIVEIDPSRISLAETMGCKTINGNSVQEVNECAKNSFAIITATGRNNIISEKYDVSAFIGKILANMGGGDEFGENIPKVAALADKAPINFAIDKPTLMKYIDPIFYFHNLSAEILTHFDLHSGVTTIPSFLDHQISSEWEKFHGESI